VPFYDLGGDRLFYRSVGDGQPCLAMHGGLGLDHTCLFPFLNGLRDVFRLIYYDHRGNGRSTSRDVSSVTLDKLTADADRLRADVLRSSSLSIIASSFGALVALRYALDYPDRVRRLILVGASPCYSAYRTERLQSIKNHGASATQLRALLAKPDDDDARLARRFSTLGPLYFYGKDKSLADRVFGRTKWSGQASKRSAEIVETLDLRGDLADIVAPTLLAVGDADLFTPPRQSALLAANLPNATVSVFPRSGHFPYVEEPAAFQQTVRSWASQT
jgi:proline iminopeptidase